ncbi:MAG: histidine--tRNA ligase, partial [Chloroflexota bacterium]|jgi:histidyl-tRNA synthetase
LLPEDEKYWRFIERTAVRVAEQFGYGLIRTPTFEDTSLFIRGIGESTDIVSKEMYTFEDKGGENLTLRPEGTAPVLRAYLEHGMANRSQPVRLYYLMSMYRYDRPQAGRFREFHQFGCEAIGDGAPTVDAETVLFAWRFFEALGLQGLSIQLNSIGCPGCRPSYLKALVEHFTRHQMKLCHDCQRRLSVNPLRLLDCKQEQCQPAILAAPASADHLCQECREHFAEVRKLLDVLELPIILNPRLVRGLDYYTRTVFEIWPMTVGAQSSVCGGGRYDGLMEQLGGKPTPGIGFAAGIERIILNIKEQGIQVPEVGKPDLYLAYLGSEAKIAAFQLADEARRRGIACVTAVGSRSLKAQMKQANNLGARYAFILGEQEVKDGTVSVRDMLESRQWQENREAALSKVLETKG